MALLLRMNERSAWIMSKHCPREAYKEKLLTNFAEVSRDKAENAGWERPSDIKFDMKPKESLETSPWVGRRRESWGRHVGSNSAGRFRHSRAPDSARAAAAARPTVAAV